MGTADEARIIIEDEPKCTRQKGDVSPAAIAKNKFKTANYKVKPTTETTRRIFISFPSRTLATFRSAVLL